MHVFSYACLAIDLDPITFIYEFDLDIHKMHQQTENERFRSRRSKLRAQTGHACVLFRSCDADLDPMTFIYEHDPYPLKMYPQTIDVKNIFVFCMTVHSRR